MASIKRTFIKGLITILPITATIFLFGMVVSDNRKAFS